MAKKTTKKAGSPPIKTRVSTVALKAGDDIKTLVQKQCDSMAKLKYTLSASFTHLNILVMVFQRKT